MEILFENSHVRNKELAKELYRYTMFKRPIMVFIHVALLLSFACNIALIWDQSSNWAVLIVVPLYFAYSFWRYHVSVSSMLKRDREAFGGEVTVQTVVTDTCVRQTIANGPNNAANETKLSNIKKVVQSKNLIILWTNANLLYIFHKDTFGARGKDEFLAFLRGKGIKVK